MFALKAVIIVLIIGTLSGCFRTAMPNFYNGRYYMAGDDNCVRSRMLSNTRIMCVNSDGKETGYRDAMTDQQLQMYQHNKQMAQQQSLTLNCYTIGNITNCY